MRSNILLSLLALPLANAADTILGVYMFHRHGDRTDKTHGAKLTSLGYREVYESGQYFRDRYISGSATAKINGISTDTAVLSQLYVSAPDDTVLMSSAVGFMQGLYPAVGTAGTQTLRNGTTVEPPLDGYQIVPVHLVSAGIGLEDTTWLQGASGCGAAINSSAQFSKSAPYQQLLNTTKPFYQGLAPMVNTTFNSTQLSYQNAYAIFDILNVARVDNVTFPSSDLLTNDTFHQLKTLADVHELGLAYNVSSPVRSIAGAVLAAQIVDGLNATISGKGKLSLNIQFGAYGTFFSFFGLSGLLNASSTFYGIPDYNSVMVFEAYTTGSISPYPSYDDIRIRFFFRNGTTSDLVPSAYPLFSQPALDLSWAQFAGNMTGFAVGSQEVWCRVCGNSTGVCAATATGSSAPSGTTKAGMGSAVVASLSSVLGMAVLVAAAMAI